MNIFKETISETNNKSIKGEELLNSLLIKGKYATFNSGFSNDEIYTALQQCKDLLPLPCCDNDIMCDNTSPLSARQGFCSNAAIELIMENKYNDALHEFEDCIDDYGKGKNKYITKNEIILYNCILSCFISKLEMEKVKDCDNCEHSRVLGDEQFCDIKHCEYKPMTQLVDGITECCGYDFGIDGFGKSANRINFCPICGKKIWK